MKFQKFHLNRIKYLILIILSIVYLPSVRAIVNPTSDFYVNDYANILSSETEEYIKNKSIALNNADGTQIVVVTVPNLEGLTIEDYANKLFNNFGIGSEEKNNGLLLLLALEEREFRVEVGYGLEGILPDGKTGRFQGQYMIPYLSVNNWDVGIKNGYNAFYKEIVTLNNLNINYNEPIYTDYNEEEMVDSSYEDMLGSTVYPFSVYIVLFFTPAISALIGGTLKKMKNKKNKNLYTFIYLIVWTICKFVIDIPIILYLHLFFFILSRFELGDVSFSSSSGGYSRGSYRSSSRSSFRGGGGRSGGGGSSRKF